MGESAYVSRRFLWGAVSKEFAAMADNISHRREQMLGVYQHVVRSPAFKKDMEDIAAVTPRDFLNAALAAGECHSIREALQKKNVNTSVKAVLRNMKWALHNV